MKNAFLSRTLLGLKLSLIFILLQGKPTPAQEMKQKSLYQRLGGYDAIAAVSDDFITRLATDKKFERFFSSLSTDSKKRLRQHIVNQICQITGGPCIYTGRDMKTAHAGLGISEQDWQTSVKHLIATLEKFKVPKKEKDELLAGVSSLKKDIVEQNVAKKQ